LPSTKRICHACGARPMYCFKCVLGWFAPPAPGSERQPCLKPSWRRQSHEMLGKFLLTSQFCAGREDTPSLSYVKGGKMYFQGYGEALPSTKSSFSEGTSGDRGSTLVPVSTWFSNLFQKVTFGSSAQGHRVLRLGILINASGPISCCSRSSCTGCFV
jgi:hypothetical protein